MMVLAGPGRRTRPAGAPVPASDADCRAALAAFATAYPEFVVNGVLTPAGAEKFAAIHEDCAGWSPGAAPPSPPSTPNPPATTPRPPLSTTDKVIGGTIAFFAVTVTALALWTAVSEWQDARYYRRARRMSNPRRHR